MVVQKYQLLGDQIKTVENHRCFTYHQITFHIVFTRLEYTYDRLRTYG